MSRLLESLLDPERRAACQLADDVATARARSDAHRAPPYWPFAPRTPQQERIAHPARHQRERRSGPRASRFGDLEA